MNRKRRNLLSVPLLLALGPCLGGCSQIDKPLTSKEAFGYLRQANARGHLTLTTNAKGGGEFYEGFRFGADSTILSFDGDVDFSRPAVQEPSDERAEGGG